MEEGKSTSWDSSAAAAEDSGDEDKAESDDPETQKLRFTLDLAQEQLK